MQQTQQCAKKASEQLCCGNSEAKKAQLLIGGEQRATGLGNGPPGRSVVDQFVLLHGQQAESPTNLEQVVLSGDTLLQFSLECRKIRAFVLKLATDGVGANSEQTSQIEKIPGCLPDTTDC